MEKLEYKRSLLIKLLYLFSSIPEITEENKGAFDIIFSQDFHSFFDKAMTHTQKNKIVF
ncbi:protein of unknown function [Streptococcus thermophilus]|nr:protein of unknown function [Streptococcus thermophilus]